MNELMQSDPKKNTELAVKSTLYGFMSYGATDLISGFAEKASGSKIIKYAAAGATMYASKKIVANDKPAYGAAAVVGGGLSIFSSVMSDIVLYKINKQIAAEHGFIRNTWTRN